MKYAFITNKLKKIFKNQFNNINFNFTTDYNYQNLPDVSSINPKNLSQADYVKLAYIVLLQREVDEVGFNYWQERIKANTFNYKAFLDTICNSPEFIMHYQVPFADMLHKGRQAWCQSLENFNCVLDIGGSSPNMVTGALIELGYSHRPKQIIIFDLPEDKQYWGKPKFPQDQDYNFEWGIVKYIHGYAEDICNRDELSNSKFDMVFMGQTIEHIKQEELDRVITWVRQHLNEGGKFIFDTPNRDITKIQMPNSYIDEDHKYEYTPAEMEAIMNKNGFKVVKKVGILDMPQTLKSQKFNPLEVYDTEVVNNHPESSYVFAFECVPSA